MKISSGNMIPLLSVGDIFQLRPETGYRKTVYLVVDIVDRRTVQTFFKLLVSPVRCLMFEFKCLNIKTLECSTEYQFLDDSRADHPFIILSKSEK